MKPKQIPGVPLQKKGGFHDTESIKQYSDQEKTIEEYAVLKERFLSVNQWKSYCGDSFADFRLHDSFGNYVERLPQVGDFIRIDIPGPGGFEAKGCDWVKIIEISNQYLNKDELENLLIICIPSTIPKNEKSHHIAHFYSPEGTSIFIISRSRNHIKAAIYGRNESPNWNANFLDKIRNFSVAVGGMVGISKIQWKRLSDQFLDF
ncbi:hypothetical protein [Chryseobacterium sp. G0201]|uniref:hypothetical protein n=1 Tax=Chryseobacterium sp. G0201 TaxID=2487065 RepID=UPI000F501F73|nr:hypothetical protein [Chryseobacterium sp. G0201]AZA54670.1 hypothetical protein EG348_17535 [Chryseobacterium sp. G0201]